MAQEPPEPKRPKHSIISDHVYSIDFQESFSKYWNNYEEVNEENLEVIAKPFRVCKISNFLSKEEVMDEIKNELLDVKSRRNCIDLYQFEHTCDLANVDTKSLKLLYETFQTDLATWMEKNTKVPLNKKISMTSSCYSDTDYLLCHDDNIGDRRIAFILYLSKNWTAEDGGALDLFDIDENGLPMNVVKSLVPEYNSLVFFEVVDNSYHQVAEVTSPDRSRWTINGWFHGPLRESTKPPRVDIEPNYVEPVSTETNLGDWIAKCYLHSGIVKEIQQGVEQESFAFLSDFLKSEVYEKLSTELSSEAIKWTKVGPADVRNYEVADEKSLTGTLKDFYNLLKNVAIFQLLENYTELDLVSNKENTNPRMTIELQRWSKGCYTLICDKSVSSETTVAESEKKTISPNNIYEHHIDDKVGQAFGASDSLNPRDTTQSSEPSTCDGSVPNSTCESGRDTSSSNKEDDDIDEDEVPRRVRKGKSPRRFKKKITLPQQTLSSKLESTAPQKPARTLDTDDSDVSDIGDYLSDPLDCSLECSDQEEEEEEEDEDALADDANVSEPGALDVIIQFHTSHVPEEGTIDYVDPSVHEGALIHIPAKDNHLCLVYKTQGTCRLHKYVNHYCKGYFYNLICTYYE